ncbi:hypothetical protein PMAYCL1PPCAC_29723, partial [Pristionchus mayeri]
LSLISLLPVYSLNCLHDSHLVNSTKVSCPVKRNSWCYSIQRVNSHLISNRDCDQLNVCDRMKVVVRQMSLNLLPSPPSFTPNSFCF